LKKYSELLEEQEKVKRKVERIKKEINKEKLKISEKELFKLAEIIPYEDWFIIFILKEGIKDEKWNYAQIGRRIGKSRALVRRKYLKTKNILRRKQNVYTK